MQAQFAPGSVPPASIDQKGDTVKNNKDIDWNDETIRIGMRRSYEREFYQPDSSIHTFHRRPFLQPWYRDLGNLGSPAQSLLFTAALPTGLSLGYSAYNVYRFRADSLFYYDANKPYSSFSFQLGSKLEQYARLLHTQNIKPNWNFAVGYSKLTSPGFYKIQRNNNDNAFLSTRYFSPGRHYELYGGIVYNKQQHDENGGIVNDSLLNNPVYDDRNTIPVNFQNEGYSTTRSSVTNNFREFALQLKHQYILGSTDTLYNADSSQFTFKLQPRFAVRHTFGFGTEKYKFQDQKPDSGRYILFFNRSFATEDTLLMVQNWTYTNNLFSLNGILGKGYKSVELTAGIGIRTDFFTTEYSGGSQSDNYVNNYLLGTLQKEDDSLHPWSYKAFTKLFFTGKPAGNFEVRADLGRRINFLNSNIALGFKQQLTNAPYSYQVRQTAYDSYSLEFNNQSTTHIYGDLRSDKIGTGLSIHNYLISNFIYINSRQLPDQYAPAINITTVAANKIFRLGHIVLDNELVYQLTSAGAPVNVPDFMGRHQLSFEGYLFRKSMQAATGIECRYHTAYQGAGYSPLTNRFYYRSDSYISNYPEFSVFFNFKVKKFRGYLMFDQLQQLLLLDNNIYSKGYPNQDFMIRFGFNWVLVN